MVGTEVVAGVEIELELADEVELALAVEHLN
jgi:hypothetical protein